MRSFVTSRSPKSIFTSDSVSLSKRRVEEEANEQQREGRNQQPAERETTRSQQGASATQSTKKHEPHQRTREELLGKRRGRERGNGRPTTGERLGMDRPRHCRFRNHRCVWYALTAVAKSECLSGRTVPQIGRRVNSHGWILSCPVPQVDTAGRWSRWSTLW